MKPEDFSDQWKAYSKSGGKLKKDEFIEQCMRDHYDRHNGKLSYDDFSDLVGHILIQRKPPKK